MRAVALVLAMLGPAPPAPAAQIAFVPPDRIDWTGDIWNDDYVAFGKVLEMHPEVKTLRLRFSRGGAERTNGFMEATLRPMRLATEAEGACISSCALIFMEGAARRFVAPGTYLHFHGTYNQKTKALGRVDRAPARAIALSDRTGRKTDAALFLRALTVPDPRGGLRVYRDAAYFCEGTEWFPPHTCERIPGATAASLGITTP